ncbi:MAG TPA: hypothetical protein PLQ94_01035 [Anaerolineales bacterium]|nr:hypothetical protein [Anaerolineales bacterium]
MTINFTPTPVLYIFIGLIVGILIGWAIGFFDSNGRADKKIKIAEANAESKIREAEKKIAQADEQFSLESRLSPSVKDDPGLLRLKKNNGRITVEMDGAQLPEVLSAERKKRLIELISNFRPWLESGQSQQAATPINTMRPSTPASVQPQAQKPEEKNIGTLSIVNQIDTVLQTRLMNTQFAKSGIRLQESVQGGVEVYVGLQKFSTVDDVPDEAIKSEIRAAIAEWEEKYTPGM